MLDYEGEEDVAHGEEGVRGHAVELGAGPLAAGDPREPPQRASLDVAWRRGGTKETSV